MTKTTTHLIGGLALALVCQPLPAAAQGIPPGTIQPPLERCLHGKGESPQEAERRKDAIAAMRMIDYAARRSGIRAPRRQWETLGGTPVVAELRATAGAVGALAKKIAWGQPEPLPGWRMEWEAPSLLTGITFSLQDVRDPCMLTLSSTNPEIVPPHAPDYRVLPLDKE